MTDPYRTPPTGWTPEPHKIAPPPTVFARMEALLGLCLDQPLAFGLGPAAMHEYMTALRADSPYARGRRSFAGVPVGYISDYLDDDEVRLVR